MRKLLTVLVATVIAIVAFTPPAAAQDQLIPRRQPISCPTALPYAYYAPVVDATHAVVGWYCTATEPVVYNGSSLTATATELNKLAGVTAGTVAVSKAVVVDANKHQDVVKVSASGIYIGVSGSETQMTATAAELNKNAGVTAGTNTASKTLVAGANNNLDVLALPVSGLKIGAGAGTAVSASAAELNVNTGVSGGTVTASKTVVVGANKNIDTLAVASEVVGADATAGAATQVMSKVIKKTGIADNTATDLITVTVPNANHAAAIRLTFVASLGTGADTFESTRTAQGLVVLARQTGANVVATATALTNTGIATVATGGTLTLAYDLGSVSGAVGASNTFTIRVTLVKTGTITDLQCVVFAEVVNAEASGVTIVGS